MTTLHLILLLIAAVLFAIAALAPAQTRFNLVAAGLFFWVLVPLSNAIDAIGD
jgi:hypothetical protein